MREDDSRLVFAVGRSHKMDMDTASVTSTDAKISLEELGK